MQLVRIILIAIFIGPTMACAPVSYQPYKPFLGGYIQKNLEYDIWRVMYEGNSFTHQLTFETYWLYRSAEIAIEKGYDGFEIVTKPRIRYLDMRHAYFAGDIRILKQPIVGAPPVAFDARKLMSTLDSHINGKRCDGNVCPHNRDYLLPSKTTSPPY